MVYIYYMENEYQTTRIWKQTLHTLKLIAAHTDCSIVETIDRLASQEWEQVQTDEREKDMERVGNLQEAVQAKEEGKVVLADWSGRRVTINDFAQNQQTGQWTARWSHSDYPECHCSDINEDEQFIIRGKYGRYR